MCDLHKVAFETAYPMAAVMFIQIEEKEGDTHQIMPQGYDHTHNEHTGVTRVMPRTKATQQTKGYAMAEKVSSNLPVVITTLAITSTDAVGTIEKMREASPDGFTMLNLDKIPFATADSYTWNVPTADGVVPERYLDAIIVHHHPARQRYDAPYDVNADPRPPVCVSYDGIRGEGEPGGVCAKCPYNQVGPDAECRPSRWLYLLFPDSHFPTWLSLPRTSLSNKLTNGIRRYLVNLAKGGRNKVKGGLWPWEVATRIGLAKRERGAGMVATFTEGERLSEVLAVHVKKYSQDFKASLTFPTINAPGNDPTAFPRDDADSEFGDDI